MDKRSNSKTNLRLLPNIEVYTQNENEWRWRITDKTGKKIAASTEVFMDKQNALKSLRLLSNLIAGFCDQEKRG